MAEKKKPETEIKEKAIRVIWSSVEDLPTLYANNLYVSHSNDAEFHLFFGNLTPPILFGLDEDEFPKEVRVNPVAKIVVTPEIMERFVKAMNDNYEKFKNKREEEK
ncbi:MAG: hypothetical protein XD73_0012 [Anaerolinea thermophila]|uniref:DUF3467 domain-containing protein n=1 Tax=Anaerolinea thermophila TaxID=167964 RepID=A0A124FN81_9CHLR|nr:MAG: hypothetical protein XD73_0012 [Anaerolinea thermophila]